MIESYRLFGNLCGRECFALTFHHTSEDQHVFPALASADTGLKDVLHRLQSEHAVIHELLEQLQAAARLMIDKPGPESFATLREIFDVLDRVVRSHFGYEQTELEDAIGYWIVPMG